MTPTAEQDAQAQACKLIGKHFGLSREEAARQVVQLTAEEVRQINVASGRDDTADTIAQLLHMAAMRREEEHIAELEKQLALESDADAANEEGSNDEGNEDDTVLSIDDLTVPELQEYAASYRDQDHPTGIDLTGLTKKAAIVAAIKFVVKTEQ